LASEPQAPASRTIAVARTTPAGDADAVLVPTFTRAPPATAPYLGGDQLLDPRPSPTRAPQGAASTRR
jgi:hypothetical protein